MRIIVTLQYQFYITRKMAGIYIHIPFCKKRCIYCDFYSTTDSRKIPQYIEAIKKEAALRKDYAGGETVETIYLGGGTPSQLTGGQVKDIIGHIYNIYSVSENAETTIEMNPDDISLPLLQSLKEAGVNRLSMGIQTFNEQNLKFLNRRHTAAEAIDKVKMCQDCGFDNISIDLIYGMPVESHDDWIADIEKAISLGTQHISAYHLIYEEGTRMTQLLEQGIITETDEEESLSQFKTMIDMLKSAGFVHYEISNFCKPGFESKHNSSYWKGKKYTGIGPSAHSFDGNNRQWNIANLDEYIYKVNNGQQFWEEEILSTAEKYNDLILTSLRTMWGLDMNMLERSFGKIYLDYCMKNAMPHIERGTLSLQDGIMKLTENGIFVSDDIMSDLMYV